MGRSRETIAKQSRHGRERPRNGRDTVAKQPRNGHETVVGRSRIGREMVTQQLQTARETNGRES
eukprot:2761326-Lingulodinium_polyedra.AAC.1